MKTNRRGTWFSRGIVHVCLVSLMALEREISEIVAALKVSRRGAVHSGRLEFVGICGKVWLPTPSSPDTPLVSYPYRLP
jgi:hypothetical protein